MSYGRVSKTPDLFIYLFIFGISFNNRFQLYPVLNFDFKSNYINWLSLSKRLKKMDRYVSSFKSCKKIFWLSSKTHPIILPSLYFKSKFTHCSTFQTYKIKYIKLKYIYFKLIKLKCTQSVYILSILNIHRYHQFIF